MSDTPETRKTIRKFAHELYPHADEGEVRPLAMEVPYLYAMATGFNVWGTDWFDLGRTEADRRDETGAFRPEFRLACNRTNEMILHRQRALIADALLQGMGGQEAWAWAESRMDESGEWIYERAEHYGVPIEQIKPYPVLAEPDRHDHKGDLSPSGGHYIIRVEGKESECNECAVPNTEATS